VFLKPIGNPEALIIRNKLKDETASGFDEITVKLLRQVGFF